MKSKLMIYLIVILLTFVFVSSALSEISWSIKDNRADPLRQAIGLPSVAVGNLSPSARNPGVELLCTGLYDVPGGYCNYFTLGVSFTDFPMANNFTANNNLDESGK